VIWSLDDADEVLRCAELWVAPEVDVAGFEVMTRQSRFPPGVGLPGRVWASGQPAWIRDVVTDTNFTRAQVAAQGGAHCAFGFRIRGGDSVIGVMEFFSREIRQPDNELLEMFDAIGNQIGLFIERRRAAEELKKYADYLEGARQAQEENANRLAV